MEQEKELKEKYQEFKELYKNKEGFKIYQLIKDNPKLRDYLSNKEVIYITSLMLGVIESQLDEINSQLEKILKENQIN